MVTAYHSNSFMVLLKLRDNFSIPQNSVVTSYYTIDFCDSFIIYHRTSVVTAYYSNLSWYLSDSVTIYTIPQNSVVTSCYSNYFMVIPRCSMKLFGFGDNSYYTMEFRDNLHNTLRNPIVTSYYSSNSVANSQYIIQLYDNSNYLSDSYEILGKL